MKTKLQIPLSNERLLCSVVTWVRQTGPSGGRVTLYRAVAHRGHSEECRGLRGGREWG